MNQYILTLLMASLAAALVELLAPRGDGGRIAGHVRMIAGLFLLVSLLTPLQKGIAYIQNVADGSFHDEMLSTYVPDHTAEDYEAAFGATLSSVGQKEIETWVKTALADRFSIASEQATVEAVCRSDGQTLAISEIRIGLSGSASLTDPHPIESYITEQMNCPCYVTVGQ